MRSLLTKLKSYLPKKRKEAFLDALRGEQPRVRIKNAVVGCIFEIWFPEHQNTICAMAVGTDRWAYWFKDRFDLPTTPVAYATERELCMVISEEMSSFVDGSEINVLDPSKVLVFYGS